MENYTESEPSTISQLPGVPFNVCITVVIISIIYAIIISVFVMMTSLLIPIDLRLNKNATASAFFIIYVFNDIVNVMLTTFVCDLTLKFYISLFVDKVRMLDDAMYARTHIQVLLWFGLCLFWTVLLALHIFINPPSNPGLGESTA